MRLALVLFNLTIALILTLYNVRNLHNENETAKLIDQAANYSLHITQYLNSLNTVEKLPQNASKNVICQFIEIQIKNPNSTRLSATTPSSATEFCSTQPAREYNILDVKNHFIKLALNEQLNAQQKTIQLRQANSLNNKFIYLINFAGWSLIGLIFLHLFIGWRKSCKSNERSLLSQVSKNHEDFIRSQNLMLSVMEDIQEQKNKAEALAKDNHQLAVIVQESQDAVIRINKHHIILDANQSAMDNFSIDNDSFGIAKFIDVFPEDARPNIEFSLNNLDETTKTTQTEFTIPDKHNPQAKKSFVASLTSITEQIDGTFYIAFVAKDITYIHQQQTQLKNIIEQAPNALIMCDTKGTVVMCNAEAANLFNYGHDELIGQPIEALVPMAIRGSHPKLRQSFFDSPKARAMGSGRDLTAQKKGGELFPVEIGLNPLSTSSGTFVIASIVDISERKRTQTRLEFMNNELQQKNFEMEQFIYTVSHDLKAPLVTIGGFTQRLSESLADVVSEKQAHQLNRIKANVNQMEALLNDLVELSRVIQGNIEKEQLNSSEIVNKVLATLENDIDISQAKIIMQAQQDSVYANKRLLSQCVQNLISNAIKYRDKNRPLEITVNTIHEGAMTKLIIADNGLGIAPKYHEKIFRIFERLDVGEGTGIGLTIVKTVMEKHRGRVELESELGVGSRFVLHFPNAE